MKLTRILWIALALTLASPVTAQTWPSKPVTIIHGYTAGTGIDVVARYLAQNLRERTGQPFVVEIRSGAMGNLAAQYVARAPADGYTILLTANSTHAANIHLFKELGFDPVKDFTPVTTVLSLGFALLVNPAVVPVNSVAELTDYIKARPGKVAYGSGTATARIVTELYLERAALKEVTYVPYKGSSQALNDLLGGQIQFLFADAVTGIQQMRGGKARALAVTNATRVSCAPEIPTMAEAGLQGYDLVAWFAMFLPAKAPRDIAQKLSGFSNSLFATESGREFLKNLCLDPYPGNPESLAKLIESDTAKWGGIIKRAHIEPQ
ncbi:MAG: tripartite tricarboxylate transporter substrate binding protein [Betaproteobacteria bacterium]|nr:MAG: tripartite tricarboxylate transporter substrate binding protein [Betaproteobacteria bacterium]